MSLSQYQPSAESSRCIFTIHLKAECSGSDTRTDAYGELIRVEGHFAYVRSHKYAISANAISIASISLTTFGNAFMGYCGRVINVEIQDGSAIYTIDIPAEKSIKLCDGSVILLQNVNLRKYWNIHKSKRTKKAVQEGDFYDECDFVDEGID